MSIRTEAKFRVSICGRWHPRRCDAIEWVSRDEFRAVGSCVSQFRSKIAADRTRAESTTTLPPESFLPRCQPRVLRSTIRMESWVGVNAHADRIAIEQAEIRRLDPLNRDLASIEICGHRDRSFPRCEGREFLNTCLMEAIGAETGEPTLEMTIAVRRTFRVRTLARARQRR